MTMPSLLSPLKQKPLPTTLFILTLALIMPGCVSSPKKPDLPLESAPQGKAPHIPDLTRAQVKVLWVPEKIESDRWEEGHFLYVIDKPSTWERSQ